MKRSILVAMLLVLIAGASLILIGAWLFPNQYRALVDFFVLFSNEEVAARYIKTFGAYGPVVFIGLQILQVVAAPIPGEATGIIGGYLFGTLLGFVYSTIGLTIGSCLAFGLGRWLGHHFVRRFVNEKNYEKFVFLTRVQGKWVTFLLFLIPGFPKDFLCYILGISPLPFGTFFLLSTVGRIPGTWLLSMQGKEIRATHYESFFVIVSLLVVGLLLLYWYRDRVFRWMKLRQLRKERSQRSMVRGQEGR